MGRSGSSGFGIGATISDYRYICKPMLPGVAGSIYANKFLRYASGMHMHIDSKLAARLMTGLFGALILLTMSGLDSVRAQSNAAPKCATLLTVEELTTAVGEKMKEMGARQRGPGETECPWMLSGGSGGFKTVAVQFYELSHIKASPTASTPDAYFEMLVSAAEGTASGKRELLPKIGQKAAFVPTTPQVLAVVQRADGIARIVGNNLTKAQITAVARAVATP
jgi:hypothetical protein